MTLEQEIPIFSKSKKDYRPPHKFTHVAISNKYFVGAMQDGTLLRMNLHNPQETDSKKISVYIYNNYIFYTIFF